MMCHYKKILIILPVILSFFMVFTTTAMLADIDCPLEPGETIVEERIIDKTHMELFTTIEQQLYLKKIEYSNSSWQVTDVQSIYPKWTGLITKDVRTRSNQALHSNIEAELRQYGLNPQSLPPIVDYSGSQFLPPVGEQHENSCVGWAVGYYLRSFQQAKDFMWRVKTDDQIIREHVYSPTFIYNQINSGVDSGSSLHDAAELLKTTGAATLHDFPYIPGDFYTPPSEHAIASAYPNRIREWCRLFSKFDTPEQIIVQRVKEYLNTGDLVVAGGNIGYSFCNPRKGWNDVSTITIERNTPFKHAYVIVGYDDTFISTDGTGAFIILSSWGEGWGDQGFCHMSYAAFTANIIEGFVFTDLINNVQGRINIIQNDPVKFSATFSGACTFDYNILNDKNELVYEQKGVSATLGNNSFIWSGNDMQDNKTTDGQYSLHLTTYNTGQPAKTVTHTFEKASKAERIDCNTNAIDGYIHSVDIPITFKSAGVLSITIQYDGVNYSIINDTSVQAGDSIVYSIDNKTFDFNGKDLDKINVLIDIN